MSDQACDNCGNEERTAAGYLTCECPAVDTQARARALEHYRAGYSCGYSDAIDGRDFRDDAAGRLFLGMIPRTVADPASVVSAAGLPPLTEDRLRSLHAMTREQLLEWLSAQYLSRPASGGPVSPPTAPPADERTRLHGLLSDAYGAIDPEVWPEVSDRIIAEIGHCDGPCTPPLDAVGPALQALIAVTLELVAAMRAYEMDVEWPAPQTHRDMMDRADAILRSVRVTTTDETKDV